MPEDPAGQLYDLLGALFRSGEELQRFLALEGINLSSSLQLPQVKRSKSATVYEVATALIEQDRADSAFFAALERRAPDRVGDIAAVKDDMHRVV